MEQKHCCVCPSNNVRQHELQHRRLMDTSRKNTTQFQRKQKWKYTLYAQTHSCTFCFLQLTSTFSGTVFFLVPSLRCSLYRSHTIGVLRYIFVCIGGGIDPQNWGRSLWKLRDTTSIARPPGKHVSSGDSTPRHSSRKSNQRLYFDLNIKRRFCRRRTLSNILAQRILYGSNTNRSTDDEPGGGFRFP